MTRHGLHHGDLAVSTDQWVGEPEVLDTSMFSESNRTAAPLEEGLNSQPAPALLATNVSEAGYHWSPTSSAIEGATQIKTQPSDPKWR